MTTIVYSNGVLLSDTCVTMTEIQYHHGKEISKETSQGIVEVPKTLYLGELKRFTHIGDPILAVGVAGNISGLDMNFKPTPFMGGELKDLIHYWKNGGGEIDATLLIVGERYNYIAYVQAKRLSFSGLIDMGISRPNIYWAGTFSKSQSLAIGSGSTKARSLRDYMRLLAYGLKLRKRDPAHVLSSVHNLKQAVAYMKKATAKDKWSNQLVDLRHCENGEIARFDFSRPLSELLA